MSTRGLLLAAGAGRRMGQPKALMRDEDGTSWLHRAIAALSPCQAVTVVLGAEAARAARLLPLSVDVVLNPDWESGMGSSLRAGLAAMPEETQAAMVSLVDLPDVTAEVTARVLAAARGRRALARAAYDGRPGHPVLLGRDHWEAAAGSAAGDRGARDLLARSDVVVVECGDLADGHDVDSL